MGALRDSASVAALTWSEPTDWLLQAKDDVIVYVNGRRLLPSEYTSRDGVTTIKDAFTRTAEITYRLQSRRI